jgi:hypothetical protein
MSSQQNKAFASWEKFLNPVKLKQSLVEASVFLTAYEMFRQSVIDNLRSFYSDSFNEGKFTQSAEYKTKVIDLYPRDIFHASCLWFQQSGAIDQSDLDFIQRIRDHRNAIAHELPKFISSVEHAVEGQLLAELFKVVTKVDRWWITEVEIPTNPDFDDAEPGSIAYDKIQSGNMIMMNLILSVFFEDESYMAGIYKQFREQSKTRDS